MNEKNIFRGISVLLLLVAIGSGFQFVEYRMDYGIFKGSILLRGVCAVLLALLAFSNTLKKEEEPKADKMDITPNKETVSLKMQFAIYSIAFIALMAILVWFRSP